MKKLTDELCDSLFDLHKNCWTGEGDCRSLRSHSVTLYAQEIAELYKEGYDVKEHIRFVSYYRTRLYKAESKLRSSKNETPRN